MGTKNSKNSKNSKECNTSVDIRRESVICFLLSGKIIHKDIRKIIAQKIWNNRDINVWINDSTIHLLKNNTRLGIDVKQNHLYMPQPTNSQCTYCKNIINHLNDKYYYDKDCIGFWFCRELCLYRFIDFSETTKFWGL